MPEQAPADATLRQGGNTNPFCLGVARAWRISIRKNRGRGRWAMGADPGSFHIIALHFRNVALDLTEEIVYIRSKHYLRYSYLVWPVLP